MQPTDSSYPSACRAAAAFFGLLLALGEAPRAGADIAATWDGAMAAWTSATHWSSNPVFPNNAAPDFYDVTINAGTVTLDQNIGINRLTLGGGTLDGAFALAAAEGLLWTGGKIAGSGTLTLGAESASTFASAGTLVLSGRTIQQRGVVTFSGGIVEGGADAALYNVAGATFTALDQAAFFANSVDPAWTFENAGTFVARATTGAGFTSMDAIFNNHGAVSVEVLGGSGHTLQFGAGGTHSGSFALAADTAVVFGGATSFLPGASFSGAGAVVTAGTVSVATDLSLPSLNVVAGGFDLGRHAVVVSGSAEWGSGAEFALELSGASAGDFGALEVGATALIDGVLLVRLASGFTPGAGDIFPILTAVGGVGGIFSNAPLDGDRFDTADGTGSFAIGYEVDTIFLTAFAATVVPEPNGLMQMLVGLSALLAARWRRRIDRSGSAEC